jgi:hypothetical protein
MSIYFLMFRYFSPTKQAAVPFFGSHEATKTPRRALGLAKAETAQGKGGASQFKLLLVSWRLGASNFPPQGREGNDNHGTRTEPGNGFTPRHEGGKFMMKLGLRDHRPVVPSCEKLTFNPLTASQKPLSLMKRRFRGFRCSCKSNVFKYQTQIKY